MDLEEALAQTKSAMLRAEAEGFDNTANALRDLAAEIERLRTSGSERAILLDECVPVGGVFKLQ